MKSFPALFWAFSVSLLAQTPPVSTSTGSVQVIPDLARLPKDTVLVQVNDVKITADDLDRILLAYPDNVRVWARGPGREQFFDQVVRTLVLNQEGKRRKVDEDPTYKAQAAYSLAGIMANLTLEQIKSSVVVTDTDLQKYLADHQLDFTRLKTRQILVRFKGSAVPVKPGQADRTEEEALAKAKDLLARIRGGADFAEVARAESDDPGSAPNGGDIGVFGHGQIMPSYEEAAYKLKDGEISEPVRSSVGYHLIQLQERQVKPFEELRPQLEAKARPALIEKKVSELVNKAKVILAPEILPASKMTK